jgi:hypothetical protein
MRGPLGNPDFTVSVFTAVIVTSAFAFFLDAPSPLVVVMLVLGLFTALVEHRVHSPPPRDDDERAAFESKFPHLDLA